MEGARWWRVGDLAEAAGLTVRTLHHYEHIGLLRPTGRTEGGQRLYDARAAQRLYRIRALRDLGLALPEIARTMDDAPATLGDLLRAHRARVDGELARLARLRELLDHACRSVERGDDPDVLATIEAMSQVSRHAARRASAAPTSEREWRALGDALRACMDAGEAPDAPRVAPLARVIQVRIAAFAEGDPETLQALAHLRHHAPPDDLAGWDPALVRYLDQALERLPAAPPQPEEEP